MGLFGNLFGTPSPQEGSLTASDREKAVEKWHWIEDQLRIGNPSNLKLAIIEADKIVDESLQALYPSVKEMAERMKLAQKKFADRQAYDDFWYAHKVRNVIVHETSYDLQSAEAINVIGKYRRSLEILGVL